jgi:alpha-beta hydrolase superfamily lysophospholipase
MTEAPQYVLPTLQIVAGCDVVVDNVVSKQVFDALGATDKTFLHVPDVDHYIGAFDPDWRNLANSVQEWIQKRI